jgi:hypothetical protein
MNHRISNEIELPVRGLSIMGILLVCSKINRIASSTDIIGNGE